MVEVNETSVKLEWDHSSVCFEDCDITFNLTWSSSHGDHSVETMDTMFCITSLKCNEDYEATLTALCREQSQVTMVSRTVSVAFNTCSGDNAQAHKIIHNVLYIACMCCNDYNVIVYYVYMCVYDIHFAY